MDRQACRATVHGVAESDRTEHSVQETKPGYLLFLLLPIFEGQTGG